MQVCPGRGYIHSWSVGQYNTDDIMMLHLTFGWRVALARLGFVREPRILR